MIDSVLKGTGNSRFLKSAVPAGTSWADALAMLQAGTFPIDFNGINAEGFQQVGTPLNKANLLKDATAAQIGLPPSTTPDGMFQALGNTGELHVWRKTVVSSSEQPAGYTLGDVITNSEIWVENRYEEAVFHYATSISVSDAGLVSLVGEKTATIGHSNNGENIAEFDVFKGKFIYISGGDNNKRQFIFYIPANATFHRDGNYSTNKIYADKEQRVNAHGIIHAGTTTTYPVSTNPNAYQEGDDAKEAGYVVGEVENNVQILSGGDNWPTTLYYADSVDVDNEGQLSLQSPNQYTFTTSSQYQNVSTLAVGRFIKIVPEASSGFSFRDGIWFVPSDATVTVSNYKIYASKIQKVTGYAAIPASTTIEYLGKLGDKAMVQVISYVGTGAYGSDHPNSLTFDFVPKMLFVVGHYTSDWPYFMFATEKASYAHYSSQSHRLTFTLWNKTVKWYYDNADGQLNLSGRNYDAVAIG